MDYYCLQALLTTILKDVQNMRPLHLSHARSREYETNLSKHRTRHMTFCRSNKHPVYELVLPDTGSLQFEDGEGQFIIHLQKYKIHMERNSEKGKYLWTKEAPGNKR